MRGRDRILANLEELYRGEFERANAGEEPARMAELDFGFQRDQIFLEALLDLRDLLSALPTETDSSGTPGSSLLDKAQALRRLTRLR
ncbi:MAG: hypothetical protein KC645_16305 [Gemmatimonadetes bacterium]|nr:hypothetical protein [Gemmatimonadota bacterium]